MALPKKFRLKKDKDIKNVFLKGRTVKGSLLFIKFLKNSELQGRVAVLISKKISNKAVVRNLIRRRIYASFEQNNYFKKIILIGGRLDVIIIVLPVIVGKAFKEIKADFDQIIKKLSVQV